MNKKTIFLNGKRFGMVVVTDKPPIDDISEAINARKKAEDEIKKYLDSIHKK